VLYNTLYVNFYAGPCSGKSILANELYPILEKKGIPTQVVSEYAKDEVWKQNSLTLKCQPYILGCQLLRQFVLKDKIQVALVDSPLPLGLAYKGFACDENWERGVIHQFNSFRNLNFLIERNHDLIKHKSYGRIHDLDSSLALDRTIKDILDKYEIPFTPLIIQRDGAHLEIVTNKILEFLNLTDLD